MHIRNPKIEDLKRISYITRLSWKKPYKKEGVIGYFNEDPDVADLIRKRKLFILVAIVDEKIVGAVRYKFIDEDEVHFSKLVTLPSFRGRGIGSALVKKLEAISKRKNVKKISLEIMEEKLLAPFYTNLGYKALKKVKRPNHHEIHMVKELA